MHIDNCFCPRRMLYVTFISSTQEVYPLSGSQHIPSDSKVRRTSYIHPQLLKCEWLFIIFSLYQIIVLFVFSLKVSLHTLFPFPVLLGTSPTTVFHALLFLPHFPLISLATFSFSFRSLFLPSLLS